MGISYGMIIETAVTLIGIVVAMLTALAIDRLNERRRSKAILRSLRGELGEARRTPQLVKNDYRDRPRGKSFYIDVVAWETASAGGDLAEIIGIELSDAVASNYAPLVRIRYYVDLMTQLWLSLSDIVGYEEIRGGFKRSIVDSMGLALKNSPRLIAQVGKAIAAP